jgi:hypothetical protein
MGPALVFFIRALFYSSAGLVIGGAVKKLLTAPADECIESGLRIADAALRIATAGVTHNPEKALVPLGVTHDR